MTTVTAPYPSTMDEIDDSSIVLLERPGDASVAHFLNRGGDEVASLQVRNKPSKAVRRIGSVFTPWRDVLIKDWYVFGQPNVKLADPASVPTTSRVSAWSPDGNILAVGSDASPWLITYQRAGDVFTKMSNPASLPSSRVTGLAWSPDGQYLLVADHDLGTRYHMYQRNSGSNPLSQVGSGGSTLSGGIPPGTTGVARWSQNGTYLFVTTSDAPYYGLYKRYTPTSATFVNLTALPEVDALGSAVLDASWSHDGKHLAVALDDTAGFMLFKRSGDTFTKLPGPTAPGTQGRSVAYSLDDNYLAVGLNSSPYLAVYRRDGDIYTKLSDGAAASSVPAIGGLDWSPDGKYVGTACISSPRYAIWELENEVLTQRNTLLTLPTGTGYDLKWSPAGKYLVVNHATSPSLSIYKSANGPIAGAAVRIDPNTVYPG